VTGKLPDVTDASFQAEVLDSEQPVLVDFWAPWCGPCRVVHPILEEIAAERQDELRIVSLNVDDNQQTAARYEVLSIPTLIVFRDGAEAKRVVGALPKRRLEAELEPALVAS
jgi:thioredoxin 1